MRDQDGLLVASLTRGDSVIDWRSSSVKDYSVKSGSEWETVYLSNRLNNLFKKDSELKDVTLTILFWNNLKQPFSLKDFTISIKKGNEKMFGLYEDMD